MATGMDGVSVAASIAGLLSLAVQITGSLASFYGKYKDQDTEIARTTEKAEGLLSVLQTLDDILQKRKFGADERDLVQVVERKIQSCSKLVKDLEAECERFKKDSAASGWTGLIQATTRRVAYPFRNGTLRNLAEDISDIRANLSSALDVLQVNNQKNTQDELQEIKGLIQRLNASHISSKIRRWLNAPDSFVDHNAACTKRHTNTGLWLIKGQNFINWLEQSNSFLWINGFAGCGKSILCSTAIQYTFREKGNRGLTGIAFFYFTFSDSSKQDASAMLRALLLQLSGQLLDEEQELEQLYRLHEPKNPAVEVLLAYLERIMLKFHDVYIFLDAIDESPLYNEKREEVLSVLDKIRKRGLSSLHILTTSRDEFDIRECLSPMQDQEIPMKSAEIDKDIINFISNKINFEPKLQRWKSRHAEIEAMVMKRAQGL